MLYTHEELEKIDAAGVPKVKSAEKLDTPVGYKRLPTEIHPLKIVSTVKPLREPPQSVCEGNSIAAFEYSPLSGSFNAF